MDNLHECPTRQPYPAQFFQQGKPQQKTNKKWNPFTGKFIEGARVVTSYIKGLSEQYRHTLAEYKVRVFFKGTSTIKSLIMHPKDPIPDTRKPLEVPSQQLHSWIHRWNQQVPERKVLDHRNQTTSAIRNHHISTKQTKAECTWFHNNRQRQQHPTP